MAQTRMIARALSASL
ncbi:hypothetical protein ACHAW5_008835 [Stephanodiscus triporus]|uniref:Uncharacterized protein n=1 Tax=Stephanodiscus triporus TaxID=2934178 RepID=A0ABD3MD98_9STRA